MIYQLNCVIQMIDVLEEIKFLKEIYSDMQYQSRETLSEQLLFVKIERRIAEKELELKAFECAMMSESEAKSLNIAKKIIENK